LTVGSAVASTIRYVRVSATVNSLALFFLPVLGAFTNSIGVNATVKASAVAGLQFEPPVLFPFSPISHNVLVDANGTAYPDPTVPDFGYTVGQQYDLTWPTTPVVDGGSNKQPCDGDNDQQSVNQEGTSGTNLGLIAFNGTAGAVQQVQDDVNTRSVDITNYRIVDTSTNPYTSGDYLNPGSGDKNAIVDAINNRIQQDTDQSAVNYVSYHGNGRRLITVIVNSGYGYRDLTGTALPGTAQWRALGYAQFLLLPSYDKSGGGNNAWCAIYVGDDPEFGTGHTGFGGNGRGQAFVRLTQ
jgi:hypothetical protein